MSHWKELNDNVQKGRAGLVLRTVTDKAGRQVKRWFRSGVEAAKEIGRKAGLKVPQEMTEQQTQRKGETQEKLGALLRQAGSEKKPSDILKTTQSAAPLKKPLTERLKNKVLKIANYDVGEAAKSLLNDPETRKKLGEKVVRGADYAWHAFKGLGVPAGKAMHTLGRALVHASGGTVTPPPPTSDDVKKAAITIADTMKGIAVGTGYSMAPVPGLTEMMILIQHGAHKVGLKNFYWAPIGVIDAIKDYHHKYGNFDLDFAEPEIAQPVSKALTGEEEDMAKKIFMAMYYYLAHQALNPSDEAVDGLLYQAEKHPELWKVTEQAVEQHARKNKKPEDQDVSKGGFGVLLDVEPGFHVRLVR